MTRPAAAPEALGADPPPPAAGRARREGLAWLAGLAALCACSEAPRQPDAPEDTGDRLWPAPPEQPRFVFETALRAPADIVLDSDERRFERALTGQRQALERVLEKPAAVAAREGRIYVTDSVRRAVVVFDVPRRKVFGLGQRAPGTLAKPISLAIDRARKLYVADATLRKVLVYDGLGLFLHSLGDGAGLQRPTGVAVSPDGERIHVIDRADNDSELHRVLTFGADGRLLRELGRRGRGPAEFNVPVQGATAPDGTLHVLDAGNFRVQSFDAEGRFLRSFGSVGTGLGQFARPRGLACDTDGRLYVTDTAFGNVQVFSPQGELLLAMGRGDKRNLPGRYGLLTGVAVDETGRVYLVDQLFGKVEVIRRLSDAEGRALQRGPGAG